MRHFEQISIEIPQCCLVPWVHPHLVLLVLVVEGGGLGKGAVAHHLAGDAAVRHHHGRGDWRKKMKENLKYKNYNFI